MLNLISEHHLSWSLAAFELPLIIANLLFFKNFDLPRPDKWGTVQLVSLMQQILTHGDFYNEELQWIKIEKIQFVFSMSSAEKCPIIRIASMHQTTPAQLQTIYSHYLSKILEKTDYGESGKVQSIAAAMVLCRWIPTLRLHIDVRISVRKNPINSKK